MSPRCNTQAVRRLPSMESSSLPDFQPLHFHASSRRCKSRSLGFLCRCLRNRRWSLWSTESTPDSIERFAAKSRGNSETLPNYLNHPWNQCHPISKCPCRSMSRTTPSLLTDSKARHTLLFQPTVSNPLIIHRLCARDYRPLQARAKVEKSDIRSRLQLLRIRSPRLHSI